MAAHRIQIFNPQGKRRGGKAKAKTAKRNPLSELIFMTNGAKKQKKAHNNPFGGKKKKSNKHDAFSRSRGGHRNPSRQSSEGLKGWAELGGGGLLALFGSNYLAEMFFAGNNTGVMGYAITAGIGLAIAFVGGKFLGKKFATGAGIGTLLAVAYRAYQDYANTPTGKVNQIAARAGAPSGNSDFSGGMGTYTQVAFPYPANYQFAGGPGSGLSQAPSVPALPAAAIPAAMAATGAVGALERDARY